MRLPSLNRSSKLPVKSHAVHIIRVLKQRFQALKFLCFVELVNFFFVIALSLIIPNQTFAISYASAQESANYQGCKNPDKPGGVKVDCYCKEWYKDLKSEEAKATITKNGNVSPYEWKCENTPPDNKVRWIDFYEACKNVYGLGYIAELQGSKSLQDWICKKGSKKF